MDEELKGQVEEMVDKWTSFAGTSKSVAVAAIFALVVAERYAMAAKLLAHPSINCYSAAEQAVREVFGIESLTPSTAQSREREIRAVKNAFDDIAKANTVTILSLDEMESVVLRWLSGEFRESASSQPKRVRVDPLSSMPMDEPKGDR